MEKVITYMVAFIILSLVALLFTLPIAYLLMMFLGNLEVNLSFWGAIPGALVLVTLRSPFTLNKGSK